jgi:hypothetical protein
MDDLLLTASPIRQFRHFLGDGASWHRSDAQARPGIAESPFQFGVVRFSGSMTVEHQGLFPKFARETGKFAANPT